jgi:hypothetical protein
MKGSGPKSLFLYYLGQVTLCLSFLFYKMRIIKLHLLIGLLGLNELSRVMSYLLVLKIQVVEDAQHTLAITILSKVILQIIK